MSMDYKFRSKEWPSTLLTMYLTEHIFEKLLPLNSSICELTSPLTSTTLPVYDMILLLSAYLFTEFM